MKIIMASVLFTLANLSFAQDASNDATWEETVGFITKYLPQFSADEPTIDFECQIVFDNRKYYVDNQSIVKQNKYSKVLLKLTDINSVSISETSIVINCSDKYVAWINNYGKDNQKKYYADAFSINLSCLEELDNYKNCNLVIPEAKFDYESEKVQRLYKAFQHLAYLAGEKRKKSKF